MRGGEHHGRQEDEGQEGLEGQEAGDEEDVEGEGEEGKASSGEGGVNVVSILRALWQPWDRGGEQLTVRQGAYGFVMPYFGGGWGLAIFVDGVSLSETVTSRSEAKRRVEKALATARS